MALFGLRKSSVPIAPPVDDFQPRVQQPEKVSVPKPEPVVAPTPEPQPQPVVEEKKVEQQTVEEEPEEDSDDQDKVIYVPKSLSQTEINNLVIENNFMLKKLLSMALEE